MADYGILSKNKNVLDSKAQGPLASLYDTTYEFDNLFYPRNLDTDQRGHYIIFYINVAQKSNALTGSDYQGIDINFSPGLGPGQRNTYNSNTQALGAAGRSASNYFNQATAASELIGGDNSSILSRKTKRIQTAIALYMPDTVNVQYGANWQDTSVTSTFGRAGAIMENASSIVDDISKYARTPGASILSTLFPKDGKKDAMGYDASAAIANSMFGDGAGDFVMYYGGYAINPQLEVLFKGTDLRSFQFDFLFSPHDRSEAETVNNIIKTFKFHAAPEILSEGSGRYMVPPSEFDMDFMYKGVKNPQIHQIGTCVLTNINVDYAPNGWATFGGEPGYNGAGSPVQTRLTLQFQETEVVTKDRVREGY